MNHSHLTTSQGTQPLEIPACPIAIPNSRFEINLESRISIQRGSGRLATETNANKILVVGSITVYCIGRHTASLCIRARKKAATVQFKTVRIAQSLTKVMHRDSIAGEP